jgi:hypothetical protein
LLSAFALTFAVAVVAALPMALVIIWGFALDLCRICKRVYQRSFPHVGAALPHELQIRVGRSTRVTIHRFGVLNLSS